MNVILFVILLELLVSVSARTLEGGVSNQYGRVGVRVTPSGVISKVYPFSPAKTAGLRVKDQIVESDGVKGHDHTDGMAGATVRLVILRDGKKFAVDILRVPPYEIKNKKF